MIDFISNPSDCLIPEGGAVVLDGFIIQFNQA